MVQLLQLPITQYETPNCNVQSAATAIIPIKVHVGFFHFKTQPWNRKEHQIDVVLKHLTSDDCSFLSNSECILHFPDPFSDISLLAGIINFKILTSPFRDRIRFIYTFCCSSSPTEDNSTPWICICTSGRRVSHRWLSQRQSGAERGGRYESMT